MTRESHPDSKPTFRLMTFNLRTGADGRAPWEPRRDSVASVIREASPDLLGTQEGTQEMLDSLREALPQFETLGEGREGGTRGEQCAILYRAERFELLDSGHFWLSETPEVPGSRSWGSQYPRMATWGHFYDRLRGRRLTHLNLHLDYLKRKTVRLQAKLVRERFETLPGSWYLTGDFNSLPCGNVYKIFADRGRGFIDAWANAQKREPKWGHTFHAFTGKPFARIDWIFCPPDSRIPQARVVFGPAGRPLPSDHFPVWADIEPCD